MKKLSKFKITMHDFYGVANDGIGGSQRLCFDCGIGLHCIDPTTVIASLKHVYCPECLQGRNKEWRGLVLKVEQTLKDERRRLNCA